jgi:hypothetical protein
MLAKASIQGSKNVGAISGFLDPRLREGDEDET